MFCIYAAVCGTFTLSQWSLLNRIGDGIAWHGMVWYMECVYFIMMMVVQRYARRDMFLVHSLSLSHSLCMFVLSLCDCDYVLLYYFDLVIRSAGSQNIFFGGGE